MRGPSASPSLQPWHALEAFRDTSIPKLWNLRRARQAGYRVPQTVWARASLLETLSPAPVPSALGEGPWMVRSGSPTEDGAHGSRAGQFVSVAVKQPGDFAEAVQRVVAALPRAGAEVQGVVFVQPLIDAAEAGVTFFDGFYFEESRSPGTNWKLTAGQERGDVRRGQIERGDAHSAWLLGLHRLVGGSVDVEWALPAGGKDDERILLQARPTHFAIRRCETLSLANHQEILGDLPSPWIVGVIADVSPPVLSYLQSLEPAIASWQETYSVELAERAWVNFSLFFRLMDHWGLPRSLVTQGVGGAASPCRGDGLVRGRFVRELPTIIATGFRNLFTIALAGRGLRALDKEIDGARSLLELQRFNVRALAFSIRTNIAIIMVLSVASRLRKALGVCDHAAELVSQRMMARYAGVAAVPDRGKRFRALDRWLKRYGHRGPLESDPCQPRFSELRSTLRCSLDAGPMPQPQAQARPAALWAALLRPLFLFDEVREWFRDRLMRPWARMREKILCASREAVRDGFLAAPEDVFLLRREDLAADPRTWRDRVRARRKRLEQARTWKLPTTATRDQIEAAVAGKVNKQDTDHSLQFQGIGLGTQTVEGTAVCASGLNSLLNGKPLPETAVLIAPSLEPAHAVVFPRFAAIVADLGGELSHAAILLREAGIPAVVNAEGASQQIEDGDR
ncbi:MAG TPA: PEP-utilizing enzyme, partial [Isosphaeraceae bacterium]|nr:PEP-utilizing enzyme [Isosphaeraceae bacterium]